MHVLGFGTQALDFDNNGAIDLAVVNGHIDDLEFKGFTASNASTAFPRDRWQV